MVGLRSQVEELCTVSLLASSYLIFVLHVAKLAKNVFCINICFSNLIKCLNCSAAFYCLIVFFQDSVMEEKDYGGQERGV